MGDVLHETRAARVPAGLLPTSLSEHTSGSGPRDIMHPLAPKLRILNAQPRVLSTVYH